MHLLELCERRRGGALADDPVVLPVPPLELELDELELTRVGIHSHDRRPTRDCLRRSRPPAGLRFAFHISIVPPGRHRSVVPLLWYPAMSLHVDRADLATVTEVNPYLMGAFAPTHEELTLTDLEVVGEIPEDLNGVYVRNGPNPQFEPRGRYHWFDGDGMVHAVHISDGKAVYRNRWIRTDGFQREHGAGGVLWRGIMEPWRENPPGEPEKDTANTDVIFHNERLLALWYRAGRPYALDPITLDTLGPEDFDGTLRCEVSAHAKVDDRTGELFFFDYGVKPPYMRYGVVSPSGAISHFTGIDLPGPRLPHAMAITERYSILMDLPLLNDPRAAAAGRYRL